MAAKTGLTVEFKSKTKQFFRSLGEVNVGIKGVASGAAAAGAAAAAAGVAMAKIWASTVKGAANAGDEVGKMAARTGLSTQAIQRLQLASKLAGADIGSVEKATRRMSGTLLDLENGLSTPKRAFERLGLTLEDVKGKTPDKQFETLMGALAGVEDASTRAALAEDLFGRSGTALLPMIEKGAKGFKDLMRERDKLGMFMSDDQIDAAEEFNDSIERMKFGVKALSFKAVANSFGPLADQFNEFATSGAFERVLPGLQSIADMFKDLATMGLDILQSEAAIRGVQLAADSIGAAAEAVSELTGAEVGEQAKGTAAQHREFQKITSPEILGPSYLDSLLMLSPLHNFMTAIVDAQKTLNSIDEKMPAAKPGVAF
jgi:hypothetical protein